MAARRRNQQPILTFILGYILGIVTVQLHTWASSVAVDNIIVDNDEPATMRTTTTTQQVQRIIDSTTNNNQYHNNNGGHINNNNIYLDPFPLQPCDPDRTSALYVFYRLSIGDEGAGGELFRSIQTLLKSKFPGRVRVVIDETVNATLLHVVNPKYRYLINQVEWDVVPMPDLQGKELIPHSNKIRALQAKAFVYEKSDSMECTISLDKDTYVHPEAPWKNLLSTLQLNDVSVTKDCSVSIDDVPDFLSKFMPNTGVLAIRNTPRTRLVLNDWLDNYVPCNSTHISSCTPGTDQYSFLQLVAKHGARLHKLDNSWNCRLTKAELNAGLDDFPLYSASVLTDQPRLGWKLPGSEEKQNEDAKIVTTCGGYESCHILHGHWLKFP